MDAADQHPQDLKNQDPMFVINLGTDLLASYGWYMLLAVIGFLVLWRKTLQETVNKWRDRAQQGTMSKHFVLLASTSFVCLTYSNETTTTSDDLSRRFFHFRFFMEDKHLFFYSFNFRKKSNYCICTVIVLFSTC